jgi:hypothetical protein
MHLSVVTYMTYDGIPNPYISEFNQRKRETVATFAKVYGKYRWLRERIFDQKSVMSKFGRWNH